MSQNRQQSIIIFYSILAFLASLILYSGFYLLVNVSNNTLMIDSIAGGVVLSILIYLLITGLMYGNIGSLTFIHRIIIYMALGVLFVSLWIVIVFLINYLLFTSSELTILTDTIPLRVILSLLVFFVILFSKGHSFRYDPTKLEANLKDEEEEINPDEENEITNENNEELTIEHIAVKKGQKIDIIPVGEIIFLQAEGDYVMIHSTKGKFLKEQTMKSFENSLPTSKFVRIHRSNIVNVEYIIQIELYDKQNQLLKLKNGAQLKISPSGYKLLKKTIGL